MYHNNIKIIHEKNIMTNEKHCDIISIIIPYREVDHMTDNELLLAISEIMDKKIEPLKKDINEVKETINNDILPRLGRIEERLDRVEERLDRVEYDVRELKITLENDIKPRLQNIGNCYLTTYRRYQSGVNQIEAMQRDIDIMKEVLVEHSKLLRKRA